MPEQEDVTTIVRPTNGKVTLVEPEAKRFEYIYLCPTNGASQPILVVNDLNLNVRAGGVALWVGPVPKLFLRNNGIDGDAINTLMWR